MIKNRLAVLLAERGLKITRVAKDTGISRNSITSISQNDSEMIRFETMNTLCKYLKIKPKDFFVFDPIDIEFSIFTDNIEFSVNKDKYVIFKENKFDLYMDIDGSSEFEDTVDLICSIDEAHTTFDLVPFGDRKIYLNVNFYDDAQKKKFNESVYNQLDPLFHQDIYKKLKSTISNSLKETLANSVNKAMQEIENPFTDPEEIKDILKDFEVDVESDVFLPF